MHGYRDHCIRRAYPDSAFYCPYSMYRLPCPFKDGYRPKIEEFPVHQQGLPKNPPPTYTPKLSDVAHPNLTEVKLREIAPCILKSTYLWLKNGASFWAHIGYVGRHSISGWKYTGGQWSHFHLRLNEIKNFICS